MTQKNEEAFSFLRSDPTLAYVYRTLYRTPYLLPFQLNTVRTSSASKSRLPIVRKAF
jgi:hypothetical protein